MNKIKILSVALVAAMSVSACSKQAAVDALDLDHEDVFDLKVGECFDDEAGADEEQVTSLPMRDCDKPHDNEIFYLFDLPDAAQFPDSDKIQDDADTRCEAEFTRFMKKDYQDSEYDFGTLTPTEDTWETGDREVVCFVFHPDAKKINNSLKDSGL